MGVFLALAGMHYVGTHHNAINVIVKKHSKLQFLPEFKLCTWHLH